MRKRISKYKREKTFEKLVAEIREWDRREHNWSEEFRSLYRTKNHRPIHTKDQFIKNLMKKYKLQPK